MDVDTALRTRGATRAFLDRPVGRAEVAAILDAARYAPSGSNAQPWQVHVVGGAVRDRIAAEVRHAAIHERDQHAAPFDYYPPRWREPYLGRRRASGWGLYTTLGIAKGDHAAGLAQELRNYAFFGAPVGLFVFLDADLPIGSWFDTGTFLQGVMLAAQARGLATCPQYSWATFHRVVRRIITVPEAATLVCGVALGYADPAAPVNRFRPERLPVDAFTTWHGTGSGT
jgi:nitroreductase